MFLYCDTRGEQRASSTLPASSEISDLCEISDLLLFVSYFASQNKKISLEITYLTCFV